MAREPMRTNYFTQPDTARRYARSRPNLNPLFNAELARHIGHVAVALDVGCGTGLSTRPLTEVAELVVGLDPSVAMLEQADDHPRVAYCAGVAEAAPFADGSAELIGVGLALHWFERAAFLSEASRLLIPAGWLFVYNTWFEGTMVGRSEFAAWSKEHYLERYPIPGREGRPFGAENGWELVATWNVRTNVRMTREQLAEYLTTQSNVSAARTSRGETLDQATRWLTAELEPLFASPAEDFPFAGSATLLRSRPR
jgi:SAM-dependent methyltransferase